LRAEDDLARVLGDEGSTRGVHHGRKPEWLREALAEDDKFRAEREYEEQGAAHGLMYKTTEAPRPEPTPELPGLFEDPERDARRRRGDRRRTSGGTMQLDPKPVRADFVQWHRYVLMRMRAEIDAVRATIASEWQALRRELAE